MPIDTVIVTTAGVAAGWLWFVGFAVSSADVGSFLCARLCTCAVLRFLLVEFSPPTAILQKGGASNTMEFVDNHGKSVLVN